MSHPRPAAAGPVLRRGVRCVLALVLIACAAPALAQPQPQPQPKSESRVEFLPRTSFRLSAEHLSSENEGLVWDTNFGGSIDFVDYGFGRATFLANYQAILGEEFHKFDPNQGNYTLEGSTSARVAGMEVAAVFHHVSRHLSDREKQFPVDWNMLGVRVEKALSARSTRVEASADLRKVLLRSYVDYHWEFDAEVHGVHGLHRGISAISAAGVKVLGVDTSRNRDTQTGVRGEGGIRFQGSAGAIELFVAAERRIDPFPVQFGSESFLAAGFRFLSR